MPPDPSPDPQRQAYHAHKTAAPCCNNVCLLYTITSHRCRSCAVRQSGSQARLMPMHGMPDCITRGLPYRSMRNQCMAAPQSAHATPWYRRHSAVATYLASSVEGIYMHLCTCACARIDTAWPRQAAHTRSCACRRTGPLAQAPGTQS